MIWLSFFYRDAHVDQKFNWSFSSESYIAIILQSTEYNTAHTFTSLIISLKKKDTKSERLKQNMFFLFCCRWETQ